MNYMKFSRHSKLPALALAVLTLAATPSFAVELAAVEAEWTPPGEATPIAMWAFVDAGVDANAYACPGSPVAWSNGPALTATVAGNLTVNIKNCLSEPVSIFIPGQLKATSPVTFVDGQGRSRVRSFDAETAANAVGSYTWTGVKEGTYLYHSGTHPQVQVQMGLYGALTVGNYGYANEATLVYSEIDPALHAAVAGGTYGTAAYPSTFDYKPRYFLINGAAYPAGADIAATTGDVLLRFVNAGLKTRVPTLGSGLYMSLIAEDGNLYPFPLEQYGVELQAAKTIDAVLQVGAEGRYALYDRALGLNNWFDTGGGMLTYLLAEALVGAMVANNDPAIEGQYTIAEDGSLTTVAGGLPAGVLDNDDPGTGGTMVASLVSDVSSGAPLTLNADGSFIYTPNADFYGVDYFSYTANDGGPESNVATVTITVTPVDDAPIAVADTYDAVEGEALIVAAAGVLENDIDVDGDVLTASVSNYATTILADEPVHYYRLGESSNLVPAVDEGTGASNGAYGPAVTLPVPGLVPNSTTTAAGFDGTADSYVDTNVTSLPATGFSVEAWVNANSIGTNPHRIVAKDEIGVTGQFILWFHDGFLRFHVRNGTDTAWRIAQAPTTPTTGTTFHVAGVFDGTDVILYVDGAEVDRLALGTAETNINSLPITIGADSDPSNPRGHVFDGTIDEVAIYDSALSGTQIQVHFDSKSVSNYTTTVLANEPVHYYRLGESSNLVPAVDEGTGASNGAYGSAVTLPVPGLVPNSTTTAAGFDGTADSYVDTNVTSLPATGFSVEAWVNANSIGTNPHRIVAKDEIGVTGQFILWFHDGFLRFHVRNGTDTAWRIAQAPTTPTTGTTFHVAGVFDGTDVILYVDGAEVDRLALGTAETNINSLPITIGADSDPSNPRGHVFDGTIDEVAIYDSALSGTQIQAHFDSGSEGANPPVPNLAADGSFSYTPSGAVGTVETFDYAACDPALLCSIATVTITVVPAAANVEPIANDDTLAMINSNASRSATYNIVDIIANDEDPDCGFGSPCLDATSFVITTGGRTQRNGSIVDNGDGTVTFTPRNRGFQGTDTFQYTVDDADGATSNAATVRINVSRAKSTVPGKAATR